MTKTHQFLLLIVGLHLFLLSSFAMAEKYGPTKASDSLWKIAKTVPTGDKSIKTVQVVYAIYKLNPNAFNSGNMNELKKGVYLQLPENMETVTQLSYKDAKKAYKNHLQQLDLLQTSAKELAKAKSHYAKWKRKFRKLKAKISSETTLSYEEKKALAAQLKVTVRKQAKWKREIKKQRRLLIQKASLEKPESSQSSSEKSHNDTSKQTLINPTPTANQTNSVSAKITNSTKRAPVDKKLTQVSEDNDTLKLRLKSLEEKLSALLVSQEKEAKNHDQQIKQLQNELKKSQLFLKEKLQKQSIMEDRLAVLEEELGGKEQIIQKLRSTLATAADTMKQQQLENERLQKKLKDLDKGQAMVTKKRLELVATTTDQPVVDSRLELAQRTSNAPQKTLENREKSSESKTLQLLFILSTISLLLLLLFFYLRKINRQRKFRKRMQVVELKLKPVESKERKVDNPFKKSA